MVTTEKPRPRTLKTTVFTREDELSLIEQAAIQSDRSTSAFMRVAAMQVAREMMERENTENAP